MSDRPDWLPEPPPRIRLPLAVRLSRAATSLVSLVLVVVGPTMIGMSFVLWYQVSGLSISHRYMAAALVGVPLLAFLGIAATLFGYWMRGRLEQEITTVVSTMLLR